MKNFIKTILKFAAGFGIGGLFAYKLAQRRFAKRLETEMESIKRVYKDLETQTKADFSKNKPSIDEYTKSITESEKKSDEKAAESNKKDKSEETDKYTNYAAYYATDESEDPKKKDPAEEQPTVKKPYLISADDFGATDYRCINLLYYGDGALTEEGSDKKLPVKKTIGSNTKNFDANGIMYIRDEEKEIDYEVVKERRTYAQYHSEDTEEDTDDE